VPKFALTLIMVIAGCLVSGCAGSRSGGAFLPAASNVDGS
jgi:hypothetical protein